MKKCLCFSVLFFAICPSIFASDSITPPPEKSNVDKKNLSFYQKGRLNDPIMSFDMDPLQTKLEQHVFQIREGSPGGFDSSGGSCGCN